MGNIKTSRSAQSSKAATHTQHGRRLYNVPGISEEELDAQVEAPLAATKLAAAKSKLGER